MGKAGVTSACSVIVLGAVAFGCRSGPEDAGPPSARTTTMVVQGPLPVADDPEQTPDVAATVLPLDFSKANARDSGIFSDLDGQVSLGSAPWIDRSAALVIANRHGDGFVFVGAQAVAYAGRAKPDIVVERFHGVDRDHDDIPDHFDILLGVKKVATNGAAYGSPYREIDYPGGDVPREEGVCTDVIVRGMRNAGIDLQQTLHEDIRANPRAFPMVKTANANIDHRRVKTLLPYFERTWRSLSVDPGDVLNPWLPGDVIFMQTMGDARPDHLGFVSDDLGQSGAPLIVNNWTDGYTTAAMDIATAVPLTHRFRWRAELRLPPPHAGLEGLLLRHGLTIPAETAQVVVVTGFGWNSAGGTLRRYERAGESFAPVGEAWPVTLGSRGLAEGLGRHTELARAPTVKREGDRRSPAGVFAFGTAFGTSPKPRGLSWAYRPVDAKDRWVDDPKSRHYNTWQIASGTDEWRSAEVLAQYELGLVVEHNPDRRTGAGSAIFFHTWGEAPAATLGCTAMERRHLEELLRWLRPERAPLLVQVAGQIFPEI